MSDIKQMFERREIHYNKVTKEIFKVLQPHVLQGVFEFLDNSGQHLEGELKWEEVSLFENLVLLIGVITYEPGTTITLGDDNIVTVTEQTVDYFKRVIRIGIPFPIVADGNKEDVIQFLKQTAIEELKPIASFEDEVGPVVEPVKEINDTANNSGDYDFDLESLTEEQRQALKMLKMFSGGKQ